MFEIAWPWMWLLLPFPWLMRKRSDARNVESGATLLTPFYHQASNAMAGSETTRSSSEANIWTQFCLVCAWICLVAATSRPQWVGEPIQLDSEARDMLMAVDISPSMQETDLLLKGSEATRLEVVKSVVSNFLEQRSGDRVGLILFGAQPYMQVPLTFDLPTVSKLLEEATLGIAGNATAIGDAMGLAIKRLRERPQESRILILLTDGANTSGEVSPEQAAELAAQTGIKVYTIGVGADEMLQRGFFGYSQVNPSKDLDEDLLKNIAQTTGGLYFRAKSTGELEMIYEAINQLEPIEQKQRFYRPVKEWFYIALSSAMLFIILLWSGRFLSRFTAAGKVAKAEQFGDVNTQFGRQKQRY